MSDISSKKIIDILKNDNERIIIPIYQRNYDWSEENTIKLFSDIWNFRKTIINNSDEQYFSGSMIYKLRNLNDSIINMDLVDGQQRLTTYLLMIKALSDYSNKIPKNNYLFMDVNNSNKLKISRSKSEDLLYKILKNDLDNLSDEELRNNYYLNYKSMVNYIQVNNIDPDVMFSLLSSNVSVAWIELKQHENEHDIFETINSTGKRLTAADLIKNFLLSKMHTMTLEEETTIEEQYNDRIEDIFSSKKFDVDQFFRYYSAQQGNGKLENKSNGKNIYMQYKNHIRKNIDLSSYIELSKELKSIQKAALLFNRFINKAEIEDTFTGQRIALYRLIMSRNMTYFPMYYDLMNISTIIENNELIFVSEMLTEMDVLHFMAEYYFYRNMIGKEDANITRDIVTFYKKFTNSEEGSKDKLFDLSSFESFLNKRESEHQRLPEFKTAMEYMPKVSYIDSDNKKLMEHILLAVEINLNNKKRINIFNNNYQIEHIMPQLDDSWYQEAVKEGNENNFSHWRSQKDFISNLTLVTKESKKQISDEIYSVKKDLIMQDKFLKINNLFANYEKYSDQFLQDRMSLIVKNFSEFFGYKYTKEQMDKMSEKPERMYINFSETNFQIQDEGLSKSIKIIESEIINGRYDSILWRIRKVLENVLQKQKIFSNKRFTLHEMINLTRKHFEISLEVLNAMKRIQQLGNLQTHELNFEKDFNVSVKYLLHLFTVIKHFGYVSNTWDESIYKNIHKITFPYKVDKRSYSKRESHGDVAITDFCNQFLVTTHNIDSNNSFFRMVEYNNVFPKSYHSKRYVYKKEYAKEMLFLYLYEGLGSSKIDEIITNGFRVKGFESSATLCYLDISSNGTQKGVLKNKGKEDATKIINNFIEEVYD